MGPVQRLDRWVTASAETQRLTPRTTRDVTCGARVQASSGRPGPKQFHRLRYPRQVALHHTLEVVDLTSPPLFHLPSVQPPDPDEHVDRACIALGGQRRLRGLDDTLCKCVPVLRVHRCKTPVLKLTVHARYTPDVSAIIHRLASDFQGLVDVVSSSDHSWLGSWRRRWRTARSLSSGARSRDPLAIAASGLHFSRRSRLVQVPDDLENRYTPPQVRVHPRDPFNQGGDQ